MESIFGIFSPPIVSKIFGWILAGIAFPFETALEYQGMKDFFRNFLWHEKAHPHGSHPWLRGGAKTAALFKVYSLPFPLLC